MVEAAGTTPLMVLAACDTHIGGREHNEDAILMRPDLDLFLVADGAGGHNAGHIASALATTATAHYYEGTQNTASEGPTFDEMGLSWSARRLASAFQRANREVREVAEYSDRCDGMGTTLVAAHFDLENATVVIGHVGDSRCYRLRAGQLERLTQDHSLINDVLEIEPDIDPERARALPKNVITNALGMEDRVRVTVRTHELVPGDRYLLCSDGLTDEVDDGQIQQALSLGSSVSEAARLMIDLALDGKPRDNVAVIVLGCQVPPGVGTLPTKPVPPTRHGVQEAAEGRTQTDTEEMDAQDLVTEAGTELPSESVEILEIDDIDVDDDLDTNGVDNTDSRNAPLPKPAKRSLEEEEDEPQLLLEMTDRGAKADRRRRDDDTVITKNEK